MRMVDKSFWRQKFELSSLKDFKTINTNLLYLTGKCNRENIKEEENHDYDSKNISNLSETETVFFCLKTLFMNENQSKCSSQAKRGTIISLKSLK